MRSTLRMMLLLAAAFRHRVRAQHEQRRGGQPSDARVITALKMNGADYARGSVVTSGRIVKASGPEAAKEFALRVLNAFGKG